MPALRHTLLTGLATIACSACSPEVPDPPAVPAATAAEATPETIVLVLGCTFRADRTTPHGHTVDTTPYLARLAESGVRYERMLTNAGWTRAGSAAVVTGHTPARWGIDDTGKGIANRSVPEEVETMAERLAAAGWATAGVTANPNLNPAFGLTQGFDHYQGTDKLFRQGQGHVPAEELVDRLMAQLDAAVADKPGAPVFAQIMFIDAHDPWDLLPIEQLRQGRIPSSVSRDKYDAALARLDRGLAALDAALAERGRDDRLLIVTGDHGEGLRTPKWAGGGHGFALYDPHLHVPLVVHGPGVAGGRVAGGIAQQLDLLPTVLTLAGLPADPALPGTDQTPVIRGALDTSPTPEVLSVTRVQRAERWRLTTPEWTAMQTHKPKKRRNGRPHFELYRTSDRLQADELSETQPWVAAALQARGEAMWDHLLSIETVQRNTVSDNDLEHLRELGYIE
jgi:arylsulfatase A-like enzyme